MSELTEKHCLPCEGGVNPMSLEESQEQLAKLEQWELVENHKSISKKYTFKNFYRTMAFVNAVAWIANIENHHPDLKVGYNYCHVQYSTHAIGGLSINDFICAAKIDAMKNL